jgi:hypothetical protein
MLVHDVQAVKRNIKFIEAVKIEVNVRVDDHCCWNCHWSIMNYNCLWCEREMDDVDFRDLCSFWVGEIEGNT